MLRTRTTAACCCCPVRACNLTAAGQGALLALCLLRAGCRAGDRPPGLEQGPANAAGHPPQAQPGAEAAVEGPGAQGGGLRQAQGAGGLVVRGIGGLAVREGAGGLRQRIRLSRAREHRCVPALEAQTSTGALPGQG